VSARKLVLVPLTLALVPAGALAQTRVSVARGSIATIGSSAPTVETMVVGRSGALLGETPLRASATTVRASGRRCAVPQATPLAVLLASTRVGVPAPTLRDYGHCGSSPANSGQLFVAAIGAQRNQGQSGWEYKVGHVSGTTGAADPSGSLGNGRLLSGGQRVLWFWCVASATGCQRTLDIALSAHGPVSAGSSVTVTVAGYDNEGRGTPVAGATVTLDATRVTTGAAGRVTLPAPFVPGHYTVSASKPGLVPSFAQSLAVR
jgi:hypothetical protein